MLLCLALWYGVDKLEAVLLQLILLRYKVLAEPVLLLGLHPEGSLHNFILEYSVNSHYRSFEFGGVFLSFFILLQILALKCLLDPQT